MIRRKFIDSLRLNVKAGPGGMGLPKYGGVGGKGGNIVVVAKEGESLQRLISKYPEKTVKAAAGEDSSRKKIFGESGAAKEIAVPVGIQVFDPFKRLIGSLDKPGDRVVVAERGSPLKGGSPNSSPPFGVARGIHCFENPTTSPDLYSFAGSLDKPGDRVVVAEGGPGGSPDSSPPFSGARGVQQVVTLDLKLIADVGLVGFPNAGKSTLLKVCSRAKPKIASYPFTTIRPNLGVINYPDQRKIQMADLPGLIEGAHYNVGMGISFLKHVERTKLLLLIADVTGFQLSPQHMRRSCLETIVLLNKELEMYKEELLNKPAMLLINKMDLPEAKDIYRDISRHLPDLTDFAKTMPEDLRPERIIKFDEILPVSAKYESGDAEKVKDSIRKVLDLNYDISLIDEQAKNEMEMIHSADKKRKIVSKLM